MGPGILPKEVPEVEMDFESNAFGSMDLIEKKLPRRESSPPRTPLKLNIGGRGS
jgi:hypothetical protein